VFSGDHHEADFTVSAPAAQAAYWVEIRSTGRTSPMAWVRTNPIYVGARAPEIRAVAQPAAKTLRPILDAPDAPAWRVEHDPLSVGTVDPTAKTPGDWRFRFGLAGGAAVGQYAAFVHDLQPGAPSGDRIALTIRAERPMRVSVQLRGGRGVVDRWQKSVYVDPTDQARIVRFADCLPVGSTHTPTAPIADLTSIMIVVDTTNTKPGTAGRIWVKDAALQQ
jgi:hypothetical protein